MTDRQALLSAAGKQRPYKAVNIKPPAMPGDIYLMQRIAWRGRHSQQAILCDKFSANPFSFCNSCVIMKGKVLEKGEHTLDQKSYELLHLDCKSIAL